MHSAAEPLSASNGEPPPALLAGEILSAWDARSDELNSGTLDERLDLLSPDRSRLASLALAPGAAALTRAATSSSNSCIPETRIGPSAFFGSTCTELFLFASACTHRACGDEGLEIAMGSIDPAIDEPLAEAKGNSSAAPVQFIHRDALGSITAVTNSAGAVIYRMGYRAFGERTLTQAPQSGQQILMTGLSYTSRENSVGNSLYNYRSRYYEASLGRMLSQDTYEGSVVSPPSTHRYVYTLNNPVKYTDPSGHFSITAAGIILILIGAYLLWTVFDFFAHEMAGVASRNGFLDSVSAFMTLLSIEVIFLVVGLVYMRQGIALLRLPGYSSFWSQFYWGGSMWRLFRSTMGYMAITRATFAGEFWSLAITAACVKVILPWVSLSGQSPGGLDVPTAAFAGAVTFCIFSFMALTSARGSSGPW